MEHLKQTGTPVDDQPKAPPLQRDSSNKSNSTESPPPTARKVYTPPSPVQSSKATFNMPQTSEAAASQPGSPSGVRFSDRPLPTRPTGGPRNYSSLELSTIDQKWGRLFDNEGNPTQRLGQFLRGLANHIVSIRQVCSKAYMLTLSRLKNSPRKRVLWFSQLRWQRFMLRVCYVQCSHYI